jgi:tetratricopeptide (TPR) repeat protein
VVAFIVDSRYRSGFSVTVLTFLMVLVALTDFEALMKHRKLMVTAVVFACAISLVTAFPRHKGNLYYAWYSKGNLQVEKEDWDGAEISFSQSVKDNPDYCHAWNNLGMTYLMKKDSENAEKAFKKAVELEPENQMFRENLKGSQEN